MEYFLDLISLFLKSSELKQAKLKDRSEALSAIKEAIRATKQHIRETRTEYGDVESKELAQKWAFAAKLIRPLDDKLGWTLEVKSDYWINPNAFKEEIQIGRRRFDFRFRLEEVEKEITQFERNYK